MEEYKKRNREDSDVNPEKMSGALYETDLVLKLKSEEMFNPYIFMPHAELNSIVYNCVDTFVEKYKGDYMNLFIYGNAVNPMIQDVFREVYRSHYEDEYKKVNRLVKRYLRRAVFLVVTAVVAFWISRRLAKITGGDTIFSYILSNISCFCIWEVGYTQFTTRDLRDERKRILRAMNAEINFQ
ncbi:MAG: hypothetical protein IJF98_04205 [Firmicutes bacterium]|nr:hypothetical protein [Bacillota bacterium]